MGQVQYAAALRNYHPVDYGKIPERYEKARERKERRQTRNTSALNSFEEKSSAAEDDQKLVEDQDSLERRIQRERDRINRINNGYVNQKDQLKGSPTYLVELHKKDF